MDNPAAPSPVSSRVVAGKIYPSNVFEFDAEAWTFTAKISAVPGVLRTLWGDSLDIGFGLRSLKSGRVLFFVLKEAERADDDRYTKWIFHAEATDERLQKLRAIVLNDL